MNPTSNYEGDDDGEVDENYDPEAEVGFEGKGPAVLKEVPVLTGEEMDETLSKFRAKLYRWNDNQWKERGAGDLKFLKNKGSGRIRLLMRQDKTGKLLANHFVQAQSGLCRLVAQKTTDKAWLWTCYDLSDDEAKVEKLCGRFATIEEFTRFKVEFEKVLELNKASFAPKSEEKNVEEPKPEESKE